MDAAAPGLAMRVGMAALMALAVLIVTAPVTVRPAAAEPSGVLERIARTGVLRAGTREDTAPFAFRGSDGELAGLSVDLIEAVRAALVRTLEREIRTEFTILTPATRLEAVETHAVDLACEIATATWEREQRVEFTLPIFRDGTRVLLYRDTLRGRYALSDLQIGVVAKSTTEGILRASLPDAELTPYPDMLAALRALEAGEVDGIANVGIVLRGLLSKSTRPQGLAIVPRGEALGYESLACMVAEGDSDWRDFVNGVLRDLMKGIQEYRGGYAEIYDRWFGRQAEVVYPLDERAAQFHADMLIWLD